MTGDVDLLHRSSKPGPARCERVEHPLLHRCTCCGYVQLALKQGIRLPVCTAPSGVVTFVLSMAYVGCAAVPILGWGAWHSSVA